LQVLYDGNITKKSNKSNYNPKNPPHSLNSTIRLTIILQLCYTKYEMRNKQQMRKRCPYCKNDPLNNRRLFLKRYLGKNGLHTIIYHPRKTIIPADEANARKYGVGSARPGARGGEKL